MECFEHVQLTGRPPSWPSNIRSRTLDTQLRSAVMPLLALYAPSPCKIQSRTRREVLM